MNDLDLVRGLRSDAPAIALPPVDFAAIPVSSTRAPRLLVSAAVIAIGAAVIVLVQNGPGATPSAAAAALDRAAVVVAGHDATRPGDKQWLFYSSAGITPGQPFDPATGLRAYGWQTFDGSRYAEASSDDLTDLTVATVDPSVLAENSAAGTLTPEQAYDAAMALPAEAGPLLETLRHSGLADPQGSSSTARDYDAVVDVFDQRLVRVPPQVQANLFRALATIPGVGVDTHAEPDVLGRPVVSVTFEDDDEDGVRARSELLLDPATYAYLGTRKTALESGRVWEQYDVEAGEVYEDRAVVGPALVGHPGDVVDPVTGVVEDARR